MSRVARFLVAVWEFVVGDDWRTAAGVLVALGAGALAASAGLGGWWVVPLAVALTLAVSLRSAVRARR